jgi:lipid-A-disaccharide synthase-like uncharacterized protein
MFELNELLGPVSVSGWKLLGVAGSLCFASRWLVQVWASRRARRPVTPLNFWLISVFGSVLLLGYFTLSPHRDVVGILSNSFPLSIAAYNLTLAVRARVR